MTREQLKAAVSRTLGFLQSRKTAYQQTFRSPVGEIVLADLIVFCRGCESCVVPGDDDRSKLNAGRHEVLLRILQHLNLSAEQLFQLYSDAKLRGFSDGEEA